MVVDAALVDAAFRDEFVAAFIHAQELAAKCRRLMAEAVAARAEYIRVRYDPTVRVTPELQMKCKQEGRVLLEMYGPNDPRRWWRRQGE